MKKFVEKDVAENPLYHDTWKLLKKYRDVVWSLEISVQHVRSKFEIEYGTSIEEFLDSIYLAGADLNGSDIEHHAKCIERSHKMLKLLDSAVELLRTRHKNGEASLMGMVTNWLEPSFFPATRTARPITGCFTTPSSPRSNSKMWRRSSRICVRISGTSHSVLTTAGAGKPLTHSVPYYGGTPPKTVWICWNSSFQRQNQMKRPRANNWQNTGMKLAHSCP